MSDFDAGGLGGDAADGTYDSEYYLGVHGFDWEKGYPYDEIGYEDDNRWHLEGYFNQTPSCYHCSFSGDKVWFEIHNTDDWETDFRRPYPTEDTMCDGNDFSELFDIVAAFHPYLSAANAAIDMVVGSCGNVDNKPYDYLKWEIPLEYGSALPTDQDDAVGARTDVYNEAPASDDKEWIWCSSKFQYMGVQRRSYWWDQTDWAGDWVKYDPV